MLTLQQLRDHALANPKRNFPVSSCHQCLAADLLGVNREENPEPPMEGHFDSRVPPAFSRLTANLGAARPREQLEDGTHSAMYTGAELAAAIDTLIEEESK